LENNRKTARKISRLLVVLMLIFVVSPLSSKAVTNNSTVPQIDNVKTNVITTEGNDSVELLKESAPNSEVIIQIPSHSTVTILDKGSEYTHVSYDDPNTGEALTGYILNTNLADPTQSTSDTSEANDDKSTNAAEVKDDKSTDTAEAKDDKSTDTTVLEGNNNSTASTDISEQEKQSAATNIVSSDTSSTVTTKRLAQTKTVKSVVVKSDTEISYQALQGIALKSPTNVYQAQDANSNVLKSYAQGSLLKYEAPVQQWYKCTVILNGKPTPGYIYASDVETTDDSENVLIGTALKNPTNVYSEPSLDSKVLKSYAQGKQLKYNQQPKTDWYDCTVIINGVATHGYIKAEDVENVTTEQKSLKGIGLNAPTKIYSKASDSSKTVKTYAQGSVLKYKTFTSDWYVCTVIVNSKKITGYIKKNDVENIVDSQQSLKGIGLTSPTHVYSKASSSAQVLKNYTQGSILKYKTFTSDWYECTVIVNGKKITGYINKNNVENIVESQNSLKGIGLTSPTDVYSKASSSAKVLKNYAQGTVLQYKTFTSDWYECTVIINGSRVTGYIKAGSVDNVVSPQQNMRGIAQKSATKVYSKASTNSKVLKSYSRYTILSYKTFTTNWYECKVYVNGVPTTGYIQKGDVSTQKEINYNISLSEAVAMQMKASPKADGLGTVDATADQVEYYLNPNNFAQNSSEYFQFLLLSSYSGTTASELNNNILKGEGVLEGHGQAFITAAKTYNISELYLISHSFLETGHGTSQLAKGVKINGVTVYNMYGIGATDGNATQNGAQYAYDHGWTTIDKAIIEGAQFVSNNYIHNGQDTLYKMRWNPAGMEEKGYANHQYATDVGWAVKQTSTLSALFNELTIYTLLFEVPVYTL